MVFLTAINFIRSRGPDEFWRKRRVFKLTAGMKTDMFTEVRSLSRVCEFVTVDGHTLLSYCPMIIKVEWIYPGISGKFSMKCVMADGFKLHVHVWGSTNMYSDMQKYFGRRRNCYSIAIRNLQKALVYATKGRGYKKLERKELWVDRIDAACQEHGIAYKVFMESLARCKIALNNKVLMDIAIYEPRTFKCLTDLAKAKDILEHPRGLNSLESAPDGVITRGMI